jgi:hypothetical protein
VSAPPRALERSPATSRSPADALPALVLAAVATTVVVGVGLDRRGVVLGTPLPPFLGTVEPRVAWPAPAVAALFAGAVGAAPRLLSSRVGPVAFVLAVLVLALSLRVALATAGAGPSGWYAVFDRSFEASNEYLPALPALGYGARVFLDRFAEVVPALPVHSAGHPPGMLLTLHALGIDGARAMAALVIAAGALGVPLTYALGRALVDEQAGRVAALLFAFAPSALHHGAASADALYATVGLLAAVGLVARRAVALALGAVALAAASFFSYALLAVGAWAALVAVRRDGAAAALRVGVACAAALVLFYGALHAATGYDPVGALRATHHVYGFSVAGIRPYAYWVFGSPAAFLVAMGLPLAWYALRALGRGRPTALALAAVVVVAAVLGFTKAETERIWLFLVPLACVAAAEVLPRGRVRVVLGLLAAQAFAVELLLVTVW